MSNNRISIIRQHFEGTIPKRTVQDCPITSNMTSAKTPLTTHVLDTALGKPAENLEIKLFKRDIGGSWLAMSTRRTNADGRCPGLVTADQFLPGTYKMCFETGPYFRARQSKGFYPYVDVVFEIENTEEHYHVPLLLSPFGYSTYRGS